MKSVVKSAYTDEQIVAWLRGLLTIAWADGNFNQQEKELVTALTQNELSLTEDLSSWEEPITSEELAAVLGTKTEVGENFLRTAVMVAIADGTYSVCEAQLLNQFCEALGQSLPVLETLQHTLDNHQHETEKSTSVTLPTQLQRDVLHPVRNWLEQLEIHDPRLARFLCKMIPSQCPFEREIKLFGRKIVRIPPLCKLNPLYEQLVSIRFRALSYLADECEEDVSAYF